MGINAIIFPLIAVDKGLSDLIYQRCVSPELKIFGLISLKTILKQLT